MGKEEGDKRRGRMKRKRSNKGEEEEGERTGEGKRKWTEIGDERRCKPEEMGRK